jgi:hypothetical protein
MTARAVGIFSLLQRRSMHTAILVAVAFLAIAQDVAAAGPAMPGIVLESGRFSPGLPLAESKEPIHSVSLQVDVDAKGEASDRWCWTRTRRRTTSTATW